MIENNIGPIFGAAVSTLLVSYVLSVALPALRLRWILSRFPIINKKRGEWFDTTAVERCQNNTQGILQEGYKKYNGPFQIIGAFGKRIILPPDLAEAVKTDPRFTAKEVVEKNMGSGLPGFEGLRAPLILINTIRNNLSTNLGKFTQEIADETQAAFDDIWGTSTEWHEVDLLSGLRDVVSQISTRVFLGRELSRDKAWQNVAKDYTSSVFLGVRSIRKWPVWSRKYVHWFLKDCKKPRQQSKLAEQIIEPIVAKRKEAIAQAEKGHAEMPNDSLTWIIKAGEGQNYRAAHLQLALSMASVHTTSDLFSSILLQLCRHPEWIGPLLEEANEVLSAGGYEKTSLYQMKLADSVMKETQRIKPLGVLLSHRYANADVTLRDGTLIPKGAIIATNMSRMWDPEFYANPEEWVPDRHLERRKEPGKEQSSQLVTTNMESLGFGIGTHACPGRFFASSMLKVMLAYVLQNYEFERSDEGVDAFPYQIEYVTNPKARLRVRRKTPVA